MSGADGVIVYDFGRIDNIVGAIQRFITDMELNLRDLDKTFVGLINDGWDSPASHQFGQYSKRWWDNAEALRRTLEDLGSRLGNAAGNMQAADQAAGARFTT
jgi:WXG100 family type VII secretion target